MNQLHFTDARRSKPTAFPFSALSYIEGVKVRETALLTAVGVGSAAVTPRGFPSLETTALVFISVSLAAAGVNGLTCYLDRHWDAKMERTKDRPLPSGRVDPSKFLIFAIVATLSGLAVGYAIHPAVALAGVAGTAAALVARKTWITHYLGIVSSLTPIWMGWLAVYREVDRLLVGISMMVGFWVLIHVWSLMLAYRDDYLKAGLRIFPVTASVGSSVRWIVFLTVCMVSSTAWIIFEGSFGPLFATAAAVLSIVSLIASLALLLSKNEQSAWRLYKFSAFPYLGITFAAMVADRLF